MPKLSLAKLERHLYGAADILRQKGMDASTCIEMNRARMNYDPANGRATSRSPQRNRHSVRLQGYDYSQAGTYFITFCTQDRQCLFGHIVESEMRLNDAGKIVADEWIKTSAIRHEIELDAWVVMPNHFHGIVIITGDAVGAHGRAPQRQDIRQVGAHGRAPQQGHPPQRGHPPQPPPPDAPDRILRRAPKSLGSLVAGFKSAVTKRINSLRNTPGAKLWQRNYWEHIVRNEPELNRIREYIGNNPAKWEMDKLFIPSAPP